MRKFVIFFDPGHGISSELKQKFSPVIPKDMHVPAEFMSGGRFREGRFNREIAKELVDILKSTYNLDARLTVTEDVTDISLTERVRRVNRVCNQIGAGNVIMISIHANAFGYGNEWTSANGWEIYTTPEKTNSDILATYIFNRAKKNFTENRRFRTDYSDGDPDKEAKFAVIKGTKCPSCLTENFFYTNKDDLSFISSEVGRQEIIRTHIEGIIDYLRSRKIID